MNIFRVCLVFVTLFSAAAIVAGGPGPGDGSPYEDEDPAPSTGTKCKTDGSGCDTPTAEIGENEEGDRVVAIRVCDGSAIPFNVCEHVESDSTCTIRRNAEAVAVCDNCKFYYCPAGLQGNEVDVSFCVYDPEAPSKEVGSWPVCDSCGPESS